MTIIATAAVPRQNRLNESPTVGMVRKLSSNRCPAWCRNHFDAGDGVLHESRHYDTTVSTEGASDEVLDICAETMEYQGEAMRGYVRLGDSLMTAEQARQLAAALQVAARQASEVGSVIEHEGVSLRVVSVAQHDAQCPVRVATAQGTTPEVLHCHFCGLAYPAA